MATKRRTVAQLASEAQIDIDTALVYLWYAGFNDVIGPGDSFGKQELNQARRALGIATRRDLETSNYWMKLFKLNEVEFQALLEKLCVFQGSKIKLRPKTISRLRAEAYKCNIDPITGVERRPVIQSVASNSTSFKWAPPGHEANELHYLTADEVLKIHFELVRDFSSGPDPIYPPGARSKHLLESAVFRPHTAIGKTMKYPTIEVSAAALLHSLILDHPFHNGNKRTALVSALVFLDKNHLFPDIDENEVFKLLLQIAQHGIVDPFQLNLADREVLFIAEWLCDHCRFVEKGESVIPFQKLRRILTSHQCNVEDPTVGNKVSITREVERGTWWKKKIKLHTQISYNGDGRTVPKNTVKKLREALYLDDLHGIDSRAFYNQEPTIVTDFIARYRKILNRLAKF
jgi:death-on-curing family protein